MPEQWFLRVEGREYGPADLATLHEWKDDGRVLSQNEARLDGSPQWIRAGEIPGLFVSDRIESALEPSLHPRPHPPGFFRICFDTVALYIRGFFPFLGLTLLVVVPYALSQFTADMLDQSAGVDLSVRNLLRVAFSLCMLLLTVAALPVYIAGVQILTADLAAKRRMTFFDVLNRALKYWPRVALLSVIVYVSFAFWTIVPFSVVLAIAMGGQGFLSAFLILAVGVIQVWVVSRLFINFLFWQPCAVLDDLGVTATLRESKQFARSRPDLPWYRRPLWQGVFIASVWMLVSFVLSLPAVWPALRDDWKVATTTTDPQKMMDAMSELSRTQGLGKANLVAFLLQVIPYTLFVIALVLIFLGNRSISAEEQDAQDPDA